MLWADKVNFLNPTFFVGLEEVAEVGDKAIEVAVLWVRDCDTGWKRW